MSKLKIMHLLQSDRFSGAENVVCQIIDLFRTDKDVEMIYCSPKGPIEQSLRERNIEYFGIDKLVFSEVKRAIKTINPDIIHAHDVSAGVMAVVSASHRIPVISHMHVNNSDMSRTNMKTMLFAIISLRFRHIFWVSNSSFDSYKFKKIVSKKSSILYNVLDKKAIIYKSKNAEIKDSYDVVFVGRMQYQKDPLRLLSIIQNLKKEYNPNIRCALIGEGPMFEEVQNKISELDLLDNIDLKGFMSNPLGIVKNAKCMILTSRFEGTPMCALEALALGVPIISTPTDGMVDLINNGINGYLSDNNDEIAKCLAKVSSDIELRECLSKEAIKKFDSIMDLDFYKNELYNEYFGE
ncbi:glycosyltransferase [Enterococcus faecium]|uniref:glycosyltransferase n=1 Tax=Enterococcus faecium TaxID=1352 RepID=UPI002955413B|nr:glycosyltransferase [Enterococcus faecium]MDV7750679.1 glycosyltransferase [Enterococcus faecium]